MVDSFITLCKEQGYSEEAISLFDKALKIGDKYLKKEKRLAGDSYLDHNIRVGIILVENNAEPEVVTAGLVHGLIKVAPLKEIESVFGSSIVSLLKGVAALHYVKRKNEKLAADALRKVIIATLHDIRVIFVKLANKVDNLKSIHVFPPDEQENIAQEVLDVYAPLAYRLGLENIRVQLEDLAFRNLKPKKYDEIQTFLEDSKEERERILLEVIQQIESMARGKVDVVKIKGRSKHIYSIYRKMQKRGIKLAEQYDLIGIRVVLSSIPSCYTFLGLLHENYEPAEGRLKDYIANPKPNYYRSIHTAVLLANGKKAEIQIRTPEMDEFAEEGIAAHWRYKGVKSDVVFEKKIGWLRGVIDLQKEGREFLEEIKVDIFGDKIYCYTPKGDVKELPKGSTLLDFAFSVHEEIGSHTIGGRVNGRFVPMKYALASGDVIEVLTNKKQRPRKGWLKIVTSSKSRQKIRKSLKEHESLPSIYFRQPKPVIKEDLGVLTQSLEFPKAACVLAKCCKAIPGDDIVGLVTKRRLISVHKNDCKLALKEEKRWIKVLWKEEFNQRIRFTVEALERSGILADLLNTIARAGFELKGAKAKLAGQMAICSFIVIPRDLDDLKDMIRRVRKVEGVKMIYFE